MVPEKYTFYNISEFNNRKGIEDAIEVFSDVFGDNKDVQFLIKMRFSVTVGKHAIMYVYIPTIHRLHY